MIEHSNTEIKQVRVKCYALVDLATLQELTPWHNSLDALKTFCYKYCNGWEDEKDLVITDNESFSRLVYQKQQIPREIEARRQRQLKAKSMSDLVQFSPFRVEIKRSQGFSEYW